MRRFTALILSVAILGITLTSSGAECKIQEIKTENGLLVFTRGERISLLAALSAPENYYFAAWRVIGYKHDIPRECLDSPDFKLSASSAGPEWSSVTFQTWTWERADGQPSPECLIKNIGLETSKWPEGDYKLNFTALFRERGKADVKTDVYASAPFTVCVTKQKSCVKQGE